MTDEQRRQKYDDMAWDIARVIAEVDKQLLSAGAVRAITDLALLAERETARECAEICDARVRNCDEKERELRQRDDYIYAEQWAARGIEADRIASRIRRQFGLGGK